jgi:uncharacterized protein DUF6504
MVADRPRDSRVYGEPAEVRARDDGRPLRFVWRSRLYVVHAILEHWVISQEWWRDPAAERGQPELEFWRVEAVPGQGVPAHVYELRRDPVTGTWTICPN